MIKSPLLLHNGRLELKDDRARHEQMGKVRPGDVLADTDEPSTPTLRRFARYNSSSRAPADRRIDDIKRPTRLSPGISAISEHSHVSPGRADQQRRMEAPHETQEQNWLLRDHGPPLRSSALTSSNITIVPVPDYDESCTSSSAASSIKSSLRLRIDPSNSSSLSSRQLTSGQLKLVRSGSLGPCRVNELEEQLDLKCQTTSRKPVFGLFDSSDQVSIPAARNSDSHCCHCAQKDVDSPPLATSSPVPPSLSFQEEHLLATVDTEDCSTSNRLSATDMGDLSEFDDSRTSCASKLQQYRSCPDLLQPCLQQQSDKGYQTLAFGDRMRRGKFKSRSAPWKRKAVRDWVLDDVLMWLQYLKMDDVASILIGYDLTGSEVECWDESALENLGITNREQQKRILRELRIHKEEFRDRSRKPKRQSQYLRMPLFNLVRASSYDHIVATELSLNARDISVAEGAQGCLHVTKVKDSVPLRRGDCILEIDSQPTQYMAAVDFTKLISERPGDSIQLVVLRRAFESPPSLISGPHSPHSLSSTDTCQSVWSSEALTESDNEFQILHF